jgi:acetylornithine deacetylase
MMQVVIGHKTKRSIRATVRGRTGHSSLAPNYVNAVENASRLTVFISDMGRDFAASGAVDPLYDVGHTTAHVGMLHGGTQLNIVPDEAVFDFEFRAIREDDADALVERVKAHARDVLEPAMQAVHPETGIDFHTISEVDGLDTAPEADIVAFTKTLANRNDHAKVAFGTEGGLFQSMADIPTVVIGPGDIGRAHKADEYITLDEIEAGSAFIERLIGRCSV